MLLKIDTKERKRESGCPLDIAVALPPRLPLPPETAAAPRLLLLTLETFQNVRVAPQRPQHGTARVAAHQGCLDLSPPMLLLFLLRQGKSAAAATQRVGRVSASARRRLEPPPLPRALAPALPRLGSSHGPFSEILGESNGG